MGKQASLTSWRKSEGRKTNKSQEKTTISIDHSKNIDAVETKTWAEVVKTKRLIQQSFSVVPFKKPIDSTWGHQRPINKEKVLRIGLKNINSLPLQSSHSKNTILTSDIISGNFDIFCATEVNLAWHNVTTNLKVNEHFRGHFEFAKIITSINKDRLYTDTYQRGGTLMVCNGSMCGRIMATGDDQLLGRWTWMKLKGSNGLMVVIVTVYRPAVSEGALSTYQQHKNVLRDQDIDDCPRKKLLDDLSVEIKQWQEEGCQVITTGDFNEDVRGKVIEKFFANLGMKELIIAQHGKDAPNTYLEGSVPIDGIFGTRGIEAIYSGYGAFSEGIYSDHRLLWVDLDMTMMLGATVSPLWKPKARRLQCNNPTLVNRFNYLRLQHFKNHQLEEKKKAIELLLSQ
jgi:hypothetical protein